MKSLTIALSAIVALCALSSSANADQAGATTIIITGQAAGATPFISKLSLTISNLAPLEEIRFVVRPKPGSVTRPLSAVYPLPYLERRGYVNADTGEVTVPVFGLYDGYDNTVVLTYYFADGSSKKANTIVPAAAFDDACQFNSPVVRQARTSTRTLSYDYFLAASSCGQNSPTILDTDGAVRWVGTAGGGPHQIQATFAGNGVYVAYGAQLIRMELDGEVTVIGDYSTSDVIGFHHNIDRGKQGLILDPDTTDYIASVQIEVDRRTGEILKKWDLAQIISDAIIAGGEDPAGFVRKANGRYDFQAPEDWAHDNAVAYRASDNSIIISSRENFVICVDYDSSAIKWILGDMTKQWSTYASLRKYALAAAPGTILPVGQHSVSITKDDNLLLFDNGEKSAHNSPPGPNRVYSAPRKYKIDPVAMTATEIWNFPNNRSIRSRFRSSVYEDAADNYLVAYARAENANGSLRAELIGLTPNGQKVFDYSYPTETCCNEAYRAIPIHWERIMFSALPPPGTSASGAEVLRSDD